MSNLEARAASREYGGARALRRSMGLGANMSLGFTYLSPLTGVYSLFALGLTTAGPLSVWWLVIVGLGQTLVALVFGEVVSEFPIAGGLYPWARRLWGRRYAWMVAWIYIWAAGVTITAVAEYASGFVASLLGITPTPLVTLGLTLALIVASLLINSLGTTVLARIAQIGLMAEFVGVAGVGLYLIAFRRVNSFALLWGGGGAPATGLGAFLGAALAGLFLFYGFEACGNVAEEVRNATRSVPYAMILTIAIGGTAAFIAYVGFMLAAPDLAGVIAGTVSDPITAILTGALGDVGATILTVVAIIAFLSCMVSLQASLSRLIFSFGRDDMLPGSRWLARLSRSAVPANATLICSVLPALFCLWAYAQPDALALITSFAVLAIYVCFQMVVLAALRQRIKGWRPAGAWTLGGAGMAVNIAALAYGIFAMILLALPAAEGSMLERWTVLIGLGVVLGIGLLYMLVAAPYGRSTAPAGDAIEHAAALRRTRRESGRPAPVSHRAR